MAKFSENKKRTGTIIAIVSAAVVFVALVACSIYLFLIRTLPEDMTIAGANVGSLNYIEALDALKEQQDNLYNKRYLRVTVDGQTLSLKPKNTHIKINRFTAVWVAFLESEDTTAVDISSHLNYDEAVVISQLETFAKQFESALVETTYEVRGERPALNTITVEDGIQTLAITKGKPDSKLDTEMLYRAVISCYSNGTFELEFPLTANIPAEPDWEAISKEFCVQPVDAVMNMDTFEVSEHSYGYAFDIEEVKKAYAAAEYGADIEIPFKAIAPGKRQDQLKALLFRDILGSYTAYASSQYNRNINLKLACQSINGKVLKPGESISYNNALGKRTPEKGYKPAASYYGNEVITSYGGGICQPSSCLYYAALIADLDILERHNHGYVSSYVPLGMDATVDWSGPDLKIRNNTEYPIRIEAYASGGTVTVRLVGTDTKDYYVKMTYEVLSVTNYKTIYVDMDENNEKGYKDGQVIASPYTGYKVRTYKLKYDKATNALISSKAEATSTYSKKDKEICRIKPKETTPPATTPPQTTPPETTAPPESTPPETTETTPPSSGGGVSEDS